MWQWIYEHLEGFAFATGTVFPAAGSAAGMALAMASGLTHGGLLMACSAAGAVLGFLAWYGVMKFVGGVLDEMDRKRWNR